jgi:GTP-binding protein HflX
MGNERAAGRERNRARDVLESPLSAGRAPRVRERAVLVGVAPGIVEEDLDELAALADSAGAEPVARMVQSRPEPDPGTYVGKGKLEQLHRVVHAKDAAAVMLDHELTPGQLRSLEERLGVKIVDRTALILDIFALHARSREGKAQVELAQLNYLLPRLRGWGEAMSRLGGGIGTRGPGETKMEVDRQHIRRRITKLRRYIKDLSRTRDVKRAGRQRSGQPQIAIAGYTNAGKSTLMNALTRSQVLVADQLFATLDPTTRRLELPGGRRATISDTVGFVDKLPHDLVEAFRSTLEEVTVADLILHVADASSPALDEQIGAVRSVLGDIGAGRIPELLVLNKIDLVAGSARARLARRFPGSIAVSGLTGEGVDGVLASAGDALPHPPVEVTLLVPYGREDVTARLYRHAEVLDRQVGESGTIVRARVDERELAAVQDLVVWPTEQGGLWAPRSPTGARRPTAP